MSEIKINELDLAKLEIVIHKKICEYLDKYLREPKYIKMPLWVVENLKRNMKNISTFSIDYQTERFTYKGFIVCETISIERIEEIEVF